MEQLKINPRDLRLSLGLNQTDFWEKVGITQSGGSRYEGGERRVPLSLAQIIWIVYIERVELSDVSRDNIEICKLLKKEQPELYATLLKKVKNIIKFGI
jgi:transcriptional regulator with XRE-family HTH domain